MKSWWINLKNKPRVLLVAGILVLLLITNFILIEFIADRALYYRSHSFTTQELVRTPYFSMVSDKADLLSRDQSRWILFGDSRVLRLPNPARLGIQLQDNLSLINKGEGGISTPRATEILQKEVLPLHPVGVFAQIGINNVMIESHKKSLEAMQIFTKNFVDLCRQYNFEPVLSTIIPLSDHFLFQHFRFFVWDRSQFKKWNESVVVINQWIRNFSMQNSVRLIDLDTLLRDKNGSIINSRYDGDGVHLSDEGQRLVLENIVAILKISKVN